MLRICEDCIHNKVCNEWAVTSGIPFVNANTCENFMTADVVPRSEVEKLEEYIDDLNDSKEHLCVMLEEARADVAREVFEEVEKHAMVGQTPFGLMLYQIGVGTIAKLKKKYTEK